MSALVSSLFRVLTTSHATISLVIKDGLEYTITSLICSSSIIQVSTSQAKSLLPDTLIISLLLPKICKKPSLSISTKFPLSNH